MSITTHSIFDVFYDITLPWDRQSWVMVRSIENRHNLIAQHPELEKDILNLPSIYDTRGPHAWFEKQRIDDDLVFIYELICRQSPSLPLGRMVIFGSQDCVFYDDRSLVDGIPVEAVMPEKVLDLSTGYPQFSNLAASQEMFDNSLSAIATNQSQFAVQAITAPRGSAATVTELNGMRLVHFTPQNVPGGGKPEPLQLTKSAPETFKFAEMLDSHMIDMSYINHALRGNPPPGVTSGVAIATLSANAMEFIDGVALSYVTAMERTMEHAVNAYKKNAKIAQTVTMKGQNNQVTNRQFTGESLECISGVRIQISNPLMRTIAGRLEIAEKLLEMPKEMWPQYVSILEGRPLMDIYKGELSQQDLIMGENEMLSQGQPVPALATDDHPKHMKEHAGLLNDPTIRLNGQFIQGILDHIMEHYQLAMTSDPMLMAMIHTGEMPQAALMAPPPGQEQTGGQGDKVKPKADQPSEVLGMDNGKTANPAKDMLDRSAA